MNKWVCVTKYFSNFTYGKVYEGELNGSLLDVPNDLGERTYPALYGVEPIIRKKVYYFMTLDEWRQQQIEKIL